MALPLGRSLSLLHHIFLPPKLPDRLEDDAVDIDTALVASVGQALQELSNSIPDELSVEIKKAHCMITRLPQVRDASTGFLKEDELCTVLSDIFTNGGYLALLIAAQNAGVLISKQGGDDSIVETFELSPSHKHVVPTKGRLQRSFPGPAFSIAADTARNVDFQRAMAQVLSQMSCQDPAEVKTRTRRARQDDSTEDTDTKSPALVIELFTNMFMAAGKPVNVCKITKNTRDEVMWAGAHKPWQRSSMWLLLKVALQSFLTRSTGNHDLYKCFVLYYMGSLVRSLPVDQLETDLLHTIVSKIQRRLAKLGDKTLQEQNTWMHSVAGTLKTVTDLISKRWTDIQAADRPPYGEYLAALQDIDFKQDTYVNIPALDQYLKNLHGQSKERSPTSFKLDKWRTWTAFSSSQLPIMEDVYPSDFRHFQLLAFESWVEHYLFNWLKTNRKEPETCPSLFKLMKQYLQISRDVYEDNPEATSLSILTLLDMWMAIDIAAGVQCPLLQEYDHEIPAQVLQELLLPRVEQLRRLVRAESYLQSHTTKASCKASAFRAFGTETSLSVRYFDQSSLHKALKNEIEDSARRERRTKLDELATKTQEYQRLQHLGATTRCDYISQSDSRGGSETVHSPQCKRHAYLAAAENLDIAVHEWPLPEDDLEAKSTVFELHVPVSIGAWRDATLFLIHDVLGSVVSDGEPLETDYSPKVYSGLKQWIRGRGNKNARLGIRSTTKPTVVVHGKSRMLSEKPVQKDVCVANGLSYCYFDTVLGVVSDKAEATDWLTQQCTYSFPERSSSLKIFLERPWSQPHGQPPNEVLAAQHNCPEHMSLESFKALVSLPLGLNVQWMNLLVQLRMPSVDFRQVETCLFVLQMAYQVGPPHGRHTVRQAHMILRDEEFATALLDAVEDNYRRISENWMAYLVLGNLTWVTAKLLSVTIDDDTRVRCMSFLSKARKTAVGWARLLSARASSSTRDAERDQFRGQALDVALVCISAFDADDDTFQQLPAEDVSILLECSILVQEKNPTTIDPKDTIRVLLLSRWRRILYNNGDNLQRAAANSPSPLDTAIAQSWSTHSPGTQWTPLPRPNQQWLTSTASSVLHFNLLTAQLLVDGSPLARLPADYEAHPMYRVLFGETAMEVMPNTKSTSLRFASKTLYNGHMLEFDLAPGDDGSPSDLTVRAHHKETDSVWQLLPLRLLQGHFPTAFVDRHVHWVNLDEGTIEFRPIKKPWTGTGDHWTLSTLSEKGRQFKKQDGPALVNVKSQTASLLHKLLHPLEDNFNIHTIHLRTGGLEIDLPRLGISFTMAPGSDQLGCRQFRDYIVSPDQSIGTLIGFDSRLTVQHKTSSQKLVLIPSHGQIRFQKTGHHVRVNIKHGTADRIQAYEIDPLLGRIVDSGDLPSKLLLCYLHSLTSFALPDPLTKHTGTEQALTILESASVLSFGRLDQHCLSLLEKIASLPPTRQYCPSHHTTTQRVEWNSGVGFLAQHGRLLKAVDRILSEYEAPLVFHLEDVPSFKDTLNRIRQRTDMHLVDRDLIMSSFVRLSGFGAEDSLQREDHVYTGRDVQYDPDRSSRVYSIAFPAMAGPKRYPLGYIPFTTPADLSSTLWKLVSGSSNAEATQGPDASLGDRFIGFDTAWLKNLKVLFLRHWCRLHRELSSGTVSKYTAATWLATLAYNSSADENTLQALQVLAVSNEFVDSLMSAWPTALPPTPDDDHRYRQYINTLEAMEGVLPMFRTWHDNVLFGEYLDGLAKGIQQSSRLLSLCGPGQETDFNRELTNTGHATWNPHDHPEWLLLEVESGITIRNAQQEVAAHMISADAGNAVMQLNMGEGKSSVIVPMVATALAEGNRLVRVVVAKAQSKQMLEMLMAKTAGMIGRRIFHFPFARPVLVDMEGGRQLHRLLKTCQEERGILLVQPEHILSFRLMGLERIMRGDVDVGNIMIATQEYLDGHARDIVDESDAIFSAKFELIYTLGDARPTELSPSRWVIVQELLDMVSSAVIQLKKEAPNAVEVLFDDPSHNWPGRFPRSRLLKQDVHARFVHLVATQLCARGVRGLPVALQSDSIRTALFRYLTKFRITTAEVNAVEDSPFWTDSTKGPLLLLRGLLAGGILIFALAAKRWRINYGPAPAHRSPPTHLVVPYQSKDIPSPRSEFSHPDVVLLLTSLHYYYAGLSDEQLFHSLRTLLKDDQPEDEYAAWVRTARADLTPTFRQLSGVSLDDEWQCTDKLFPYLRHSKGAVDYYLAKIVFPTHMKESPDKISASGWDLAKTMHPTSLNVTTGFSGTNDSRHLLPLPVNTLDLPRQKHTNALVLANLVREENSVHLLPPTNESGAEALLAEVVMMQPPVRVLLDVGAQVLELSNLQAAQRWLQKAAVYSDTAPEAVVFFDDDDVLSVVDHAGRIEPLQASPYAKHLDACLVFLDEAHTRGTDLRLPTNYRAAVTLGADLTKDRLVQACMRMRKLGHGQKSSISVSDVLAWSMHGTQQELHKYMPLWAMHGRRFAWQDALWKRSATDNGYNMTQKTALEFKEVEALSLEQRYLPRNSTNYVDVKEHAASLADNALLQAIDHHCRTFTTDDTQDGDASFNEEQERELAPEIEEERQRDVPPPAVAQTHAIHHDVIHFVNTGELKQDSAALLPAFEVLQNTSVEEHVTLGLLPSLVMATVDFARTVKAKGSTPMPMDVFQRTPQFILMPATDNRVSQLLLISPYEANKLVPHLQTYHTAVRLHLYAPRINIAYAPLDSLDLYTVGASESFVLAKKLIVTLNLFAGQLYFQSWDEYADFAAFLGLVYRPGEAGVVSSADGFVRADFDEVM
ncbi:hypothetical protein SEUCBS139899_002904 [Sporothrix eucalyptigena]